MADFKTVQPLDELIEQAQRNLLDFIQAELDLGATFVDIARTEKYAGNAEHFARSKGDAEMAASTIRKFTEKIVESKARAAVEQSCSQLEESISSL